MQVSGFSFVRNGIKLGYPIKEAIASILPICDEFVIAIGRSEDETLEQVQSIKDSRIKWPAPNSACPRPPSKPIRGSRRSPTVTGRARPTPRSRPAIRTIGRRGSATPGASWCPAARATRCWRRVRRRS